MKLPENLREKFKTPLGKLILEEKATKENILKEIPPDSYVITVGDRTTEKMINFNLVPSLQIIDGQEKRKKRNLPIHEVSTRFSCNNPAGEITPESIEILKKALDSNPPVRIVVNGEEDLLVIPVCIYAPENAIIMYGQPNEGLVIVKVNPEIRNKTKALLELMQ